MRPSQADSVARAAMLCAGAMIAHQIGAKSARDALFLSSFGVTVLPAMLASSALASLVFVLVAAKALHRAGPAPLLPIAFGISAVLQILEWVLVLRAPRFFRKPSACSRGTRSWPMRPRPCGRSAGGRPANWPTRCWTHSGSSRQGAASRACSGPSRLSERWTGWRKAWTICASGCGLPAAALADLHGGNPGLELSQERVFSVVTRELSIDRALWEGHRLLDWPERSEPGSLVEGLVRIRGGRGLEHVFTLLSLVLPREPLRVAYRALQTEDEAFRGTALEYLESVLPPRIRASLWPRLDDERRAPVARRREDVLDELMRSQSTIELSLGALRQVPRDATSS